MYKEWVLFSPSKGKCLAFFGDKANVFISGIIDWKHAKERIVEHEGSL